MIWIAVDAMGGDAAPGRIVDGAIAATRHFDLGVLLVGASRQIDEAPMAALRRKPQASIKVAADLVAAGEAAALFSAGHTGASVMAAYSSFGLLTGVDRPALAATIPTKGRPAVLLDVGASVECRPQHLLQFAV